METGLSDFSIHPAQSEDVAQIRSIRAEIVADPWVTFTTTVPDETELVAQLNRLSEQGHPCLVASDGPHTLKILQGIWLNRLAKVVSSVENLW